MLRDGQGFQQQLPNNDEFYGNDCEGSTTSFGQIGYNIINADSVTIGPNNRCENVYNCFQFPVDGSAVGIHILDPYISVSANSVIKANEPSTSQIAIDNNGPNWLPSMHFGMNDLAGRNLLGNAAFEGWSSATALYYWGGVSGTSINQAGSGIYAQNTSAGTPADATTQGTYNVKIGDNATAGLGVNSGCIQVDATMNYTLAFRIAAVVHRHQFPPRIPLLLRSELHRGRTKSPTSPPTRASSRPRIIPAQSALIGTGAQLAEQQRVAHLQQRDHLQLQRDRRRLASRDRKHLDAHAQFRGHVPRAQRVLQLHDRRAIHARLHPGKYRRESEPDFRGRRGAEPGPGEHQRSRSPRPFPTA